MFNKKQQDPAIAAALTSVGEILATRKKITEAISTTVAEQPNAELALQKAREELGRADAEQVLSGAPALDVGPAYQAVHHAQMRADALAARLHALKVKLSETDDVVLEVEQDLAQARSEYIRRELNEFRREYEKAAGQLAKVLHLGFALAEGLNVTYVQAALQETRVVDPENSDKLLVAVEGRRFAVEGQRIDQWSRKPVWEGDGEATKLFEEYARVMAVVRSVAAEARRIREEHAKSGPA